MKIKIIERKIKEKEELIKSINSGKMIKLNISGIIKKRVTKIIDIPINNNLSVSEYLFKDKKERKELIDKIRNGFPKGSIIEVKEVEE